MTRRGLLFVGALVTVIGCAQAVQAAPIFVDIPQVSGGFEHGSYYVYKIPGISVPAGQEISSANLTLLSFWDWTNEPNHVSFSFVPNWTVGADRTWSKVAPPAGADVFWTLTNVGSTPATYGPQAIPFADLALMGSPFGIALDPMCHYYGKMRLRVDTKPVPEPASLLLFGTGLAGIAGRAWRRRRRQ